MATIHENELTDAQRALFQKARHANEIRNHGYAIQLMQSVLKQVPGFLDGRKLLRAAALASVEGKKSGFSLAGTTLGMTAGSTLKKDPLAAMELAEKTLGSDPKSLQGNQLLWEAANKANLPETAAFAIETLVGANPKDTKLLHQLGSQYIQMGENDKAVAVYNRIVQINPADLEANKKAKDASASATMKSGRWEEVSASSGSMSFRDLIHKKDEAVALENKSRIVRTGEQIAQQISELYPQFEENQNNVDVARRIALLYEQWFEAAVASSEPAEQSDGYLESAIWFYTHTNSILAGGDPSIARKCSDLEFKKMERRMTVLEDWLAQVPDQNDPEVRPYVDELSDLRRQRASSSLEVAKKRVADNPTDLQLRYELGETLIKAGQFTEAIPELQRAKQNPNARLKAMNLLGQCYVEKNMLDIAVKQFRDAAGETTAMDVTKKDITYRLGIVLEKMGKKEEYLECMKQIYEVDYGYLDVAKRVEGSYGS
ncbi:MAG: tetratricopeptide repeat protein [Chthoniobacteraceae bacterium]